MSTRLLESEIRTRLDERLRQRKVEQRKLALLRKENAEAIRRAEEAKRLIDRA